MLTELSAGDLGGMSGGDASPETDPQQGSSSLYNLAIKSSVTLLPSMQGFCLVIFISYTALHLDTHTHTLKTPLMILTYILYLILFIVVQFVH